MPLVTSKNKAEHDRKHMNKMAGDKPSRPGDITGKSFTSDENLADKAWALSSKKFPSGEAITAHREAAKDYRKNNDHKLADVHDEAAFSHIHALLKKHPI